MARSYMWDIAFPSYGSSALPCHVASDTVATFNNDSMDFGPWQFSHPKSAAKGGPLSLSIYEVNDYSLLTWLEKWVEKYVDIEKGWGVGLLGDGVGLLGAKEGVTREVSITSYTLTGSIANTRHLYVIPDGAIAYEHSSDKNSIISVELSLLVVGT